MSEKTKVQIQRGFCSSAGDVYPGDVVELPRHEAAIEVQKGRAALTDAELGRAAPIQTREGGKGGSGGSNGGLPGYAGQPESFPKKDPSKSVPAASAVKQAFKASGLSVEAWAAAGDEVRKAAILKIAEQIAES